MPEVSNGARSVESVLDERVLISDGLVFVSGLTAADPGAGIPPNAAVSSEYPYYGADIQKQTTHLLDKLRRLLEANGASLADVVKTQVFLTDCRLFDAFDQVWKKFFPVPPPRTTVGVGAEFMSIPGTLVAVDAIAALPNDVAIAQIDSPRLPKPLANYTPCVAAGEWLFLAGQLPTDFGATGLAPGASVNKAFPHHVSSIIAQAEYTIAICQTLLEDAGSDWQNTVRVHIFLKNVDDAPLVERFWRQRFDGAPPPFMIVGVEELLTGGAEIEIDVIALKSDSKQYCRRDDPAAGSGALSVAGTAGTVFATAKVGLDTTMYRPFAVEHAVAQTFTNAAALVGNDAQVLKVHAFLPAPSDIWAFGHALPDSVAETAAITTSPSVGDSNLSLEIVYGVDS
jgi:enamine deaminase RidA (YjgF/YER057c/UK114 family)